MLKQNGECQDWIEYRLSDRFGAAV